MLVVVLSFTGIVAASSPAYATYGPNVLYAGQSTTSMMMSASGHFELFLFGDSMRLSQQFGNFGVDVWGTPEHSQALTGARLVMQRDGNLVLRNRAGTAMWSTRTAGTGTHNRFVVPNDGNLSVYTAAGKRVWAAGSGPTMMVTGQTLLPGRYLRSRNDVTTPWVRLVMFRGGNLVLFYGSQARWSTNTHVAGSRLVGLPDGNWAIYTPQNRPIWSTRTAVHARTFLFAGPDGHAASIQVFRPGGSNLFMLVA